MQKKIPLSISILLIVLAVILTFQFTYMGLNSKFREEVNTLVGYSEAYKKLAEVDDLFKTQYIGEIDEDELLDYVISGYVAGTGDKYAYYMNAEDFSDYIEEMSGNFTGIGVYVIYNAQEDAIEVINVVEDSPAYEAGLSAGDLITAVEGQTVAELGYYKAVSMCKGEEGSLAKITVYRNGEYTDYEIERKTVKSVSVSGRMYENTNVGIIRITEFDTTTPAQFEAAVKDLAVSGAEKFIFDLRNNPGGELESIVKVLDFLLPEGPIVKITDKDGNVVTEYTSDKSELNSEMIVLINENTASAAELFSSALKDYQKATLVGKTTFGKGTVQTIRMLEDGSGVAISYRMYNPPFSENYEGVGVVPDVEVAIADEYADVSLYKLSDENDAQLQKAVEILTASDK